MCALHAQSLGLILRGEKEKVKKIRRAGKIKGRGEGRGKAEESQLKNKTVRLERWLSS